MTLIFLRSDMPGLLMATVAVGRSKGGWING